MRLRIRKVNAHPHDKVPRQSWTARLYLWACERLYDELAEHYDRISGLVSGGQWGRWQRGIWDEVQGKQILEVGCGTGALLVEGSRRGFKMTGVDLSPRMLEVARRRLNFARSNIELVHGDCTLMPVQKEQFDSVIATFPAGYILTATTLGEIHRVLRPHGRLVMLGLWVELHNHALARLLPVFYGRPMDATRVEIAQRVMAAGFTMRWVEQRHKFSTVGGLVADRMVGESNTE